MNTEDDSLGPPSTHHEHESDSAHDAFRTEEEEDAPMTVVADSALDRPLGVGQSETQTGPGLLDRISSTRVYLLSESAGPRAAKRKLNAENEPEDDDTSTLDPSIRANALTLRGTPLTQLPTARLFAYATTLGASPLALEWVSDNCAVLVFPSSSAAKAGLNKIRRAGEHVGEQEERDAEADHGWYAARNVPESVWPARVRIAASAPGEAGVSNEMEEKINALREPVEVRRAREEDRKQKGAARKSEFYKVNGKTAGKEVWNPDTGRAEVPVQLQAKARGTASGDERWERGREVGEDENRVKRRRSERGKEELDEEMDRFLANREGSGEDEQEEQPRERSRRGHRDGRGGGDGRRSDRRRGNENAGKASSARPSKTREDLDAELDAFLNAR